MILIDHRLGSFDLPSIPPLDTPGLCSLCELEAGDVIFTGNGPGNSPLTVGIELKSLSDLLSSSDNGRLQGCDTGQLVRLQEYYDIPVLLYYGYHKPGLPTAQGRVPLQVKRKVGQGWAWVPHKLNPNSQRTTEYSFLISMLQSITLAGITVQHESTKQDCALWVYILYNKLQKPWSDHRLFRTFNRANKGLFKQDIPKDIIRCARIAAELHPAIGYERGLVIARHFQGDYKAMINASEKEWRSIEGVGKVIARAVTTQVTVDK